MTWANVDDLFPEHPKVLAAGGDAAWLYICGLCFTNRNLTEGRIPKAVVPRLSDRKAPARLALRLVEVGLWHEEKDAYVIHDWEKYNEGAEKVKARKEQARNAARAKWSKYAKNGAQRSAGSSAPAADEPPNEQCDEHADSMPGAHAGAMPSHSSPTDVDRSSSSHHGVDRQPVEEEELDVVDQALLTVATAKLERCLNDPDHKPINDRAAWLTAVIAKDRLAFGRNLSTMAAGGASLDLLVQTIDRQPAAPPSPYPAAGEQPTPTYDQVQTETGEWVTVRVGA